MRAAIHKLWQSIGSSCQFVYFGFWSIVRELQLSNLFEEEDTLTQRIKEKQRKGEAVNHIIKQRESVRKAITSMGYAVKWPETEPDYCPHGQSWAECPYCS